MFANLTRQGTHPRTEALKAGTRLRWLGAALAAVATGLLASVAAIPAAVARDIPPAGTAYELGRFGPFPGPLPATASDPAATDGAPGWQIP
jgi:hypothetical protein